ncbi:MAG: exosortase A [Deltaproteobacteria bacterium CG23_combo_of_CG06-09_8_20_14_all_60_8]|nr:MAG: exosortase A [Deltaproteobacteria bacterium CG23_combo_of_CG06-09_8_20_14_all_60_8]
MSEMKPDHTCFTARPAQRPIIVLTLACLIGAFILAFLPVWQGLLHTWLNSEDYSHGVFIVPISLAILWWRRDKLAAQPLSSSWWRFPWVVLAILLYLLGNQAEITTLASYSMLFFLVASVWFLFGKEVLRAASFPLFLLMFMIPIPAQIYTTLTVPLQLFVSKVSVGLAAQVGISIYREGNVIQLPGQSLQVVQACSGLRSIVSLLGLSLLFAYFTLKSNALRALLFMLGIPVAILVNIVRVLIMIIGFYYFHYDLSTETLHTVFGTAVFVIALLFIATIRGVLAHWDRATETK